MARKTRKTLFHPYESKKQEDDFIRLTKTMMLHKKYLSLKASSKVLYSYMKMWGYPKNEVDYSISLAKDFMSSNTFLDARDELVQKGFLDVVGIFRGSHTPNKYRFSDRWYKEP